MEGNPMPISVCLKLLGRLTLGALFALFKHATAASNPNALLACPHIQVCWKGHKL